MKKQCFWVPSIVMLITGFMIIFSILESLDALWNTYARSIIVILFQLTVLKIHYHLYFRK
ncbi:MAG: hypothetical protein OEL87_03905 [Nanoarchaeota archaeon]|nr:hypothetical protein [Nanoarchaeota archaeon]